MNRMYELGFIIPNNVPEQEVPGVIETTKGWITELGGEVTNVDYWGRRRLAYTIEDFREGYYTFLAMNIDPVQIPELEHNIKFSSQIIRHLVVRLDEE